MVFFIFLNRSSIGNYIVLINDLINREKGEKVGTIFILDYVYILFRFLTGYFFIVGLSFFIERGRFFGFKG